MRSRKVTAADVCLAMGLHGFSTGNTKEKSTRGKSLLGASNATEIIGELLRINHEITLSIDILCAKTLPFSMMMSYFICFRRVVILASNKFNDLHKRDHEI